MNAVIRKKYEVPVVANETLEVHIASLRTGFEEVKTELREFREETKSDVRGLREEVKSDVRELRADNKSLHEKIDAIHTTLRDRIDGVHSTLRDKIDDVKTSLSAKIETVQSTLSAKIDAVQTNLLDKIDRNHAEQISSYKELREKMEENNGALNDKVTQLTEAVASMRGLQIAMIWVIGGVGALATAVGAIGKALHWF